MPPGISILRRMSHLRDPKSRDLVFFASPRGAKRLQSVAAATEDDFCDVTCDFADVTKGSNAKLHFPSTLQLDSGSEELLHQLVQKRLPFVILDTHANGTIVFASDAFLTVTEYPVAEVIGQSCSFLQGPERRADTCQRMRQAFQNGQAIDEAVQFCTKSGQRYWCTLSLSPIKYKQQAITHYLAIQKDITMLDCYVRSDSSEGLSDAGDWCSSECRSPFSVHRSPHCFKPKPPTLTPSQQRRMPRQLFNKPRPPLPPKLQLSPSSDIADLPIVQESLPHQGPACPKVVLHIAQDGTIVESTEHCMAMFGRSQDSLKGEKLSALLDLKEDCNAWQWGALPRVFPAVHESSTALLLVARPAPVEDWDGIQARPITLQSVTTLKALEETLQEREQELQAVRNTMEHRKQFVNCVFHEVRQPFSVLMLGLQHVAAACKSILGQLEPQQANLTTEVTEILDTARDLTEAGESMHRILNDVLMMEKLQEGKLAVEHSFHNIEDIVTTARKQTACLFHEKKIAVHVSVDEELRGVQAAYDRCRLQQVMLNLLTNASKFTPEGGNVHLHMECTEPATDNTVEFQVRVVDSGVGIPEEVQRQLFRPYVQFRAGDLQGGGGTGLGLAITKGIIEAHGGSLGVRSAVNQGAEFWFHLKLCRSPPTPLLVEPSSLNIDDVSTASFASVGDSWSADVLVVDDQALFRKYLQASLQRLALSVALASSAEEALERYGKGERWRLILSDHTMGATSGPAMVQALLAMGCTSPIVGISGDADNVNEFVAAGACYVCVKPVKQEVLQQCISQFLNPSREQ